MGAKDLRRTLVGCAVALCASACAFAQEVVVLQNGRDVEPYAGSGAYPYMNCDDTFVTAAPAEFNFGAANTLTLQPGRSKVLIRFVQLNRALGVNRVITKATLVLVPGSGGMRSGDIDLTVSKMLVDWGEGGADRAPSYWGASWNERFSSDKGNGRAWASPGLKAGLDFAEQPTARLTPLKSLRPLTDVVPAASLQWRQGREVPSVLVIEGLERDVQGFYDRHYTNFGWLIEIAASDAAFDYLQFHSSQSNEVALRPMLIVETRTTMPPLQTVDLNVTYIERTPEYLRYSPVDPATANEVYEYKSYHGKDDVAGILRNPFYMNEKKWPAEGEEVTFTAHVKNSGRTRETGPFTYAWSINDEKAGEGTYEGKDKMGLAPGEETTFPIKWKWHADHADHRDQTVTFAAEPASPNLVEVTKNNNQLTDYIEALNLGYYYDETSYDAFSRYQNGWGSYSPENWVQWQWSMWNETVMAKSRYPGVAPDGCLERVRVQRITVVPNGKLQGGNHIPDGASNYFYDGEWGTDNAPEEYAGPLSRVLEAGLIHECSHQIGAIDNYWSNMDASNEKGEGGKVHFKLRDGLYLTRGYWDWDGGLMGGGHTRPAPDAPLYGGQFYSSVTCAGLNSSLGYRRGFFGDYTYDLPEQLTLVVRDWRNMGIPNAEVTVFQSAAGRLTEEYPVVSGRTNERGETVVPPQPIMEDAPVTIATGHTLRPNPWGRVNVVGGNMVFLIRVVADGQTDYRFLKSLDANVAYWGGARQNWECVMRFAICQGGVRKENVAAGGSVATHEISRDGAPRITDGDLETLWDSGCGEGAFFEVDLGAVRSVGKIVWIGATGASFDILLSETGNFSGEEKHFFTPAAFPTYVESLPAYFCEHNDPCAEAPALRETAFTFAPTKARYVRFRCTEPGWFRISELRIFESAK